MNTCINIRDIEKTFSTQEGFAIEALDKINLQVEANDFICIIGPSGCGKSTLLRIVAGLEIPSAGIIEYKGQTHDKPTKEIGMVFQNYSLLPWKNVIDNIGLGLEFAKVDNKVKYDISMKYLEMIDMVEFAKAYPYELSGGMQQRVAIARALANEPEVILMDEPFGALDAYTRILLQKELLKIWEHNKKTILFVTHSVDEAVYLSDKIVVMSSKPGRIEEVIEVRMDRPRDRANPEFGRLTGYLLNSLEKD